MKDGPMFAAKERQRHEDGGPRGGVELSNNLIANGAVRNVIQPPKGTGIVKDDVGDEFSVDLAVGLQRRGAEGVTNRSPRGLALFYHSSSDHVRVDNRPTERCQSFANGRLTRANSARDGNSFHTSTVLTATYIPGGSRL